jgi:hypothetical protein
MTLTGLLTPEDLAIRLVEFSERYSLPSPGQSQQSKSSSASDLQAADSDAKAGNGGNSSCEGEQYNVKYTYDTEDEEEVEEEEEVPEPIDFGPVPAEPAAEAADSCRVSIKMPQGPPVVRRYFKVDPVRCLFAAAAQQINELGLEHPSLEEGGSSSAAARMGMASAFDLLNTFPKRSLKGSLDQSLAEAGVDGSSVVFQWDK